MIDFLYNLWGRILSARQKAMQRNDPFMVCGIHFKIHRKGA